MLVKLGHKTVDTLRWFVPSETGKHEVIGEVNGSELPGDPLIEQAYWASIQPSIPKKLSTINPTIWKHKTSARISIQIKTKHPADPNRLSFCHILSRTDPHIPKCGPEKRKHNILEMLSFQHTAPSSILWGTQSGSPLLGICPVAQRESLGNSCAAHRRVKQRIFARNSIRDWFPFWGSFLPAAFEASQINFQPKRYLKWNLKIPCTNHVKLMRNCMFCHPKIQHFTMGKTCFLDGWKRVKTQFGTKWGPLDS